MIPPAATTSAATGGRSDGGEPVTDPGRCSPDFRRCLYWSPAFRRSLSESRLQAVFVEVPASAVVFVGVPASAGLEKSTY